MGFVLTLTLREEHSSEPPLQVSVNLNDEVRISTRAVDDLKAGSRLGVSLMSMDQAVTLMKTRELRKDLFITACRMLGHRMADHMEDAEGWHDPSRVDAARKALGGRWD